MRLPSRKIELELLGKRPVVIGVDEVGRGAWAGPVAVGAVGVDSSVGVPPDGLADSKLLSPKRRALLSQPIRRWATTYAVGWASPAEISSLGLTAALRVAGIRALALLKTGSRDAFVLLDGNHDWLGQSDLFDEVTPQLPALETGKWQVVTRVKADRDCAVVAAASVLAKVARDTYMQEIADPGYDWAANKGYSSATHTEGLRRLGPSMRHRLAWNLPGKMPGKGVEEDAGVTR